MQMSKKPKKYRQNDNSRPIFEREMTLDLLQSMGNPLEILKELLDFEQFRPLLEPVFGFMEQTMGGLVFRGVGLVRAAANVALTNLVYNMCRFTQIVRYHAEWIKPESATSMDKCAQYG